MPNKHHERDIVYQAHIITCLRLGRYLAETRLHQGDSVHDLGKKRIATTQGIGEWDLRHT
jgi:hypothetical protein